MALNFKAVRRCKDKATFILIFALKDQRSGEDAVLGFLPGKTMGIIEEEKCEAGNRKRLRK